MATDDGSSSSNTMTSQGATAAVKREVVSIASDSSDTDNDAGGRAGWRHSVLTCQTKGARLYYYDSTEGSKALVNNLPLR